ncbi:MAG: hypothetical protein M0T78_00825 [Actinomycetota bacterium]|nr:hypothetical protein [Actinomycetota bacterium]
MIEVSTAAIAALMGVIFTLSTFERWIAKRKPHELAWTISLSLFVIAAFALAIGAQGGWTHFTFKVFYLFGAILNVPFLGVGTVYLLFGKRIGDIALAGVLAFSFLSIGLMISQPFIATLPVHQLAQGSRVFGPLPRILAGVGSGVGATVVFVGAAVSFFKSKVLRFRISNLLIALGTAVTGASGLLNSIANAMVAFSITLALGISVLFIGFLAAVTA